MVLVLRQPSITFCCLELRQGDTHRCRAAHSCHRNGGRFPFLIVQSDFGSLSSLSESSEATGKQASESRGERAASLFLSLIALPGSDVPGQLSKSLTAILARRWPKHNPSNSDQTCFLKSPFILEMPCAAESLFITDHSSVASRLLCLYREVTARRIWAETTAPRHHGRVERSSKQQLEEVGDKKTKQKEKLQDNHLTQRGFGFQSGRHGPVLLVL